MGSLGVLMGPDLEGGLDLLPHPLTRQINNTDRKLTSGQARVPDETVYGALSDLKLCRKFSFT